MRSIIISEMIDVPKEVFNLNMETIYQESSIRKSWPDLQTLHSIVTI